MTVTTNKLNQTGAAVRIPKPNTATNPDGSPLTTRLNKRMAELGMCSRREADAWIEQGWVRVDGKPAVVDRKSTRLNSSHVD